MWQYGSGRCTLKTAHRKFFLKEKRHQISMIRKEFLYNCSATLDYGCDSILHLDSSERHITKNITKAASKQAYAVLFRFCCMAEQLSKILPIASRKTKHEFLTHTPNVLYARMNRRQPFLRKWTYKGQAKKGAGRMPWH